MSSVWERPKVSLKRDQDCFDNCVFLRTDKGLPPSATGPGAEGQPGPPWVAITRQKRRGAPEQPANQQDKPGAQTLKSETGKQAKVPERAQVSKHFLSLSMQERAAGWGWGLGPLEDNASCTVMVIIEPWPGMLAAVFP